MPAIGEIKKGREIGKNGTKCIRSTRFIWHACIECDKERWVMLRRGNPDSIRCRVCGHKGKIPSLEVRLKLSISHRGNKSSSWTGGRRSTSEGYIIIWLAQDDFFYPMAMVNGCVSEHRLVVARALGRCLLPWEVVHHKNGIKGDNRIENLELLTDKRYHLVDTATKSYIAKLEKQIQQLTSRIILLES